MGLSGRRCGELGVVGARYSAGLSPTDSNQPPTAASYAIAARKTLRSSKVRPTIWMPVGTPVEETERVLRERFASDVDRLQSLIGRDLSAWLPGGPGAVDRVER